MAKAKVMIISKVQFASDIEEQENIAMIEKHQKILEAYDFQVLNLRSLLQEANERVNHYQTGPNMAIKPEAWKTFLCLNYIASYLAYCEYIYVIDNSEECYICYQLAVMARIMGVRLIYPDDKDMLHRDPVSMITLPYIDYNKNESNEDDDHDGYPENDDTAIEKPITPPKSSTLSKELDDWFHRNCPEL